jgi:hypothetical protein
MEENVDESVMNVQIDTRRWSPISPGGLSKKCAYERPFIR